MNEYDDFLSLSSRSIRLRTTLFGFSWYVRQCNAQWSVIAGNELDEGQRHNDRSDSERKRSLWLNEIYIL